MIVLRINVYISLAGNSHEPYSLYNYDRIFSQKYEYSVSN